MKKTIKICLILAVCLLVAGTALAAVALALGGSFLREDMVEVTHKVDQAFTDISITAADARLSVKPSENGECYAVCDESERLVYKLTVTDGTLHLTAEDTRRWYDRIGVFAYGGEVVLYLPERAYGNLNIESASGTLACTKKSLQFEDVSLKTSSGSVQFSATVNGALQVEGNSGMVTVADCRPTALIVSVSSGSVKIDNIAAERNIHITAQSGSVSLTDIQAETLEAKLHSGAVKLERVTVCEKMHITTQSGSVRLADSQAEAMTLSADTGAVKLERVTASDMLHVTTQSGSTELVRCDAGELYLQSTSGSVKGTLLTDKLFEAASQSGSIHCPPSVEGAGKCTVKTSSGSIRLEIAK